MANDLFRKYKSLYSSTTNSFGTGTSETITPATVVGLPTDTDITLTFDRQVTGKIERIIGTISGSNFVIKERGVDGTTEQAHTSPTVEMIWNAKDWNDLVDGILVGHTQAGAHTSSLVTTLKATGAVVNTGTSDVTIVTPKALEDSDYAKTTAIPVKASSAEINTGTDDAKFATPDALAGSTLGKRIVYLKNVIAEATAVTTGDGKMYFTVPSELSGMNLVDADAVVNTVSSSGTPTVQIHNLTDTQDMLSTRITVDENEKTSYTAAAQPVINASCDDVATGDLLRIDVDVAGTGTKGLDVILSFQLP